MITWATVDSWCGAQVHRFTNRQAGSYHYHLPICLHPLDSWVFIHWFSRWLIEVPKLNNLDGEILSQSFYALIYTYSVYTVLAKKWVSHPKKKKRPIIPHLPSPTESHKCSSQDVWWRPEDPWPKGSPRRAAGSLGPHRARDSRSSSASPAIFSDFIEDVMGSSLDFMMVISWEFMGIKPTPNPPYFNDPPMVGWIYCVTNNQWSLVESPRQNPQKLGNTRATQ